MKITITPEHPSHISIELDDFADILRYAILAMERDIARYEDDIKSLNGERSRLLELELAAVTLKRNAARRIYDTLEDA